MNYSQTRRAENEVVFKQRNNAVKELAKSLLDRDSRLELAIKFTCECSNENCREVVELTIAQYEQARKGKRNFIIVPGHEQPDIEKVVKREGHSIVEKFVDPPATDGRLNRTQ